MITTIHLEASHTGVTADDAFLTADMIIWALQDGLPVHPPVLSAPLGEPVDDWRQRLAMRMPEPYGRREWGLDTARVKGIREVMRRKL